MNTLYFKYAIEVERARSITQAAENLFMAQPNLSKAIKEMEDSVGFEIFQRTSKGVIPTRKGNMFLDYAREIVHQLEKISSISDYDNEGVQKFSISIPRGSYIAKGIVNFVCDLDHDKEINLNILETNSISTINSVCESKVNLGIIRYEVAYEQYFQDFISEKQLYWDPIWEFEYLILMSQDHPLATGDLIRQEDLKDCIEIVHGDNMIPYIAPEKGRFYQNTSLKKKIYLYERCNQFEMLYHVPSTYMWVSPIPKDMLIRYSLVQRKCGFKVNKYKDVLIYPVGYKFSQLDKKFIDRLYEAKNNCFF